VIVEVTGSAQWSGSALAVQNPDSAFAGRVANRRALGARSIIEPHVHPMPVSVGIGDPDGYVVVLAGPYADLA
jgi:hypothetical protein